ncbi:hypothetical protein E2I00_006180, partial [Balaenoptera physalus]
SFHCFEVKNGLFPSKPHPQPCDPCITPTTGSGVRHMGHFWTRNLSQASASVLVMEDCNVHSAASILASVKEQEARFERLTRALEQERRHVALQLERAQQPGMGSSGVGSGQPLSMAWQQLVLQEQSPGSQASLAMMPEAPEVLEETVTVEEDPGTPTSHVSIITSEDGTTRRTETKVTKTVKTVTTRTVRQVPVGPDGLPLLDGGHPLGPFTDGPLDRHFLLRGGGPAATLSRTCLGSGGSFPDEPRDIPSYGSLSRGLGVRPPRGGPLGPGPGDGCFTLPSRREAFPAGPEPGPPAGRSQPERFQAEPYGLEDDTRSLAAEDEGGPELEPDCGTAARRRPDCGRGLRTSAALALGGQCPQGAALAGPRAARGTLWNLSSYEPLKMVIIDHGLQTLTHEVIVPHSGWEPEPNEDSKPRDAEWTTVFKNTSGCLSWESGEPPTPHRCQARAPSWGPSSQAIAASPSLLTCCHLLAALTAWHGACSADKMRPWSWSWGHRACSWPHRNVSSDGAEARRRLRECEGLVDALLHALQSAVGRKDTDNKSVENCVCIVRNLSYHVHKEVPGADRGLYTAFTCPTALAFSDPRPTCGHSAPKSNRGKRDGEVDRNFDTLDLPKRTEAAKGEQWEVESRPRPVQELSFVPPNRLKGLGDPMGKLRPTAGALQNLSAGNWVSGSANAKGPKAPPSPGGLDDSTVPLVDKSLGEYEAGVHPEVQECPSTLLRDGEKSGSRDVIPMEALGPDGYSTVDRRECRARGSDPAGEASDKELLKGSPCHLFCANPASPSPAGSAPPALRPLSHAPRLLPCPADQPSPHSPARTNLLCSASNALLPTTLQPDPGRKAPPPGPSRPAVRLVDAMGDAKPQPVDSWV